MLRRVRPKGSWRRSGTPHKRTVHTNSGECHSRRTAWAQCAGSPDADAQRGQHRPQREPESRAGGACGGNAQDQELREGGRRTPVVSPSIVREGRPGKCVRSVQGRARRRGRLAMPGPRPSRPAVRDLYRARSRWLRVRLPACGNDLGRFLLAERTECGNRRPVSLARLRLAGFPAVDRFASRSEKECAAFDRQPQPLSL